MSTGLTSESSGSADKTASEPPAKLPNIAFCGKAGAGKTTAAGYLDDAYPMQYVNVSFATKLKSVARALWGIDGMRRDRLQALGKTLRSIDEDIFVTAASLDSYTHSIVIDDLRFPNEYWKLKELGYWIVRIEAPRETRVTRLQENGRFTGHADLEDATEKALDDYAAAVMFDDTITNNGTRDEFRERVMATVARAARRTA